MFFNLFGKKKTETKLVKEERDNVITQESQDNREAFTVYSKFAKGETVFRNSDLVKIIDVTLCENNTKYDTCFYLKYLIEVIHGGFGNERRKERYWINEKELAKYVEKEVEV